MPDNPQSNLDAEIEEANSGATTITSSTPTTNTPFPTPTTTSNATSTSTATTIAITSAGRQPSSSRSLSRPPRMSAKNMTGRPADAKREEQTHCWCWLKWKRVLLRDKRSGRRKEGNKKQNWRTGGAERDTA